MVPLARARLLLMSFLVLSLPLVIYPPNTSYTYTKTIFALFMISFLLALWLVELSSHWNKGYMMHAPPLFFPLLALVGAGALSMANSQSLTTSLESLTVFIYFAALYLLIANAIENLHQGSILLGSLLAAGSLVAVYALLQYWQLLPGPPRASGSEAMISTLGNKNYVAEFLSFLFIPGLIPLFQGSRPLSRLLALASLGVMIAVLFIAGARGAWFALILSVLFFATSIVAFRLTGTISQNRKWLWALLVLTLTILLILTWAQVRHPRDSDEPLPGMSLELEDSIIYANGSGRDHELVHQRPAERERAEFEQSLLLRLWSWRTGWEMFKDQPLLGVGLGNYKLRFLAYKAELLETRWGQRYNFYVPRAAQAHNEYIQIAAEMGGLGLLGLVWALLALLRGIIRLRKEPPQVRLFYLSLYGGVIAFLADSLVSFPLHQPTSALTLTVFLGLLHAKGVSTSTRLEETSDSDSAVILRKGGIAALVVIALAVMTLVGVVTYRDFRANLYLEAGRWDLEQERVLRAKEELERGARLAFQPADSLFYLGQVYGKLGDYRQAISYLERSLRGLVVESSYLLLAQAYAQLVDDEKAWEYLHRLLATEPHPAEKIQAYYLRAELFRRRGDLEMALAQLEHVIRQAGGLIQVRAYVLRAEIYSERGDSGSARASYLRGLEVAEMELQQRRGALREQLTGEGMPLFQYTQIAREIAQLEEQVEEIHAALEPLPFP